MTKANIDVAQFVEGIHKYIAAVVRPLVERIKALEGLQTKTLADAYRGIWIPNPYERGAIVTHKGGLWLAVQGGDGRPGESATWKLIVKAGRDGKDAAA